MDIKRVASAIEKRKLDGAVIWHEGMRQGLPMIRVVSGSENLGNALAILAAHFFRAAEALEIEPTKLAKILTDVVEQGAIFVPKEETKC